MKNLIVLAVAALFATNAVAAEMKWTGSTGWRYSQNSNNDSLDSKVTVGGAQQDASIRKTKSHQIRANLGVMGGWENVEYGFGVRTTGATINTDYTNLAGTGADLGIGIEQAWFRYVRDFGSLELAATVGRQKNALVTDSAWQTHFDNDIRFDGFGWNFKFGMFGFNAAQYILGSTTAGATGASSFTYTEATQAAGATQNKFAVLYAFQPHMTWKFSDEIEALFAVALYKWNSSGNLNTSSGGVAGNTAGSVPAIAPATLRMNNKSTWDVLANVSLPFNLAFTGNYVKSNKTMADSDSIGGANQTATYAGTVANSPEISSSAWTLGLSYGKLRKAQDFTVGYAYGTKGLASVVGGYTNDKFAPDNKGHTIIAGYSLADNFHMGFRWMSLTEKEGRNLSGAAAVAGLPYAGVNGGQKSKINYWELTAGVAF